MRVLQTTFGVFHHFELARELSGRGLLQRVYSTFPWRRLQREGLPREMVVTFPWVHTPEMLMRRFRMEQPSVMNGMSYANALLFDTFVAGRLRSGREPMPDVLIGLSGTSLDAGQMVQRSGGRFVCDRGSSHRRSQERVVAEEFRRWKVAVPARDERDIAREERIYAVADAITVPSSFAARSFVEEGLAKEKIHTVPYGARLEHFRRVGEPSGEVFEVLFAGSVGLRKGFPYLLRAFAELPIPRRRLRVAGAIQREMGGLLRGLPTEGVEFLGPVPQARLPELMSESHVMVLPSLEEGLALVQGQALACGCPVIASTNTGAEDLFTDGVEGFIVPIRDVAALRERMLRLAEDRALQERMSEAAERRVRLLGGWGDYGDRWEALLQELVGRG